MHRIYLIQQTHYQKDIYKIIVSEQLEHVLLKSYGKVTEILGMIVIKDNFRELEKQIKNSFNNKFRLFHGKENYQGNRDEIKLEFLKIVYNYELRSLAEEQSKISEDNIDLEKQLKCQYCDKTFTTKYILKKHNDTTKCIQNRFIFRTQKEQDKVASFINYNELNLILNRFIDDKIIRISREEYESALHSEKQRKRTKPTVLFDWFIDYINKILVKSKLTKTDFYDLIEKHNLELIVEDENSYYLCKHIANQSKVNDVVVDTPIELKVNDVVVDTPIESKVNDVVVDTPIESKVNDVVVDTPIESKVNDVVVDTPIESKVNDVSPVLIRRNKFNNYEEIQTGLVFHKVTKKVIGRQISDGTISTDLSEEDIKNVNKYKFQIDCKDNSETGYSFIILLPL